VAIIRLKGKGLKRVFKAAREAKVRAVRKASKAVPAKPVVAPGQSAERRVTSDGIVTLCLPIRLTNGNQGRTRHYGESNRMRALFEQLFRAWFPGQKPFETPVKVTVIRVLGSRERSWDLGSWQRGNWKEIEDALVAAGWFHDDSPKWIRDVQFEEVNYDRSQYSRLRIRIEPVRETSGE